MRASWPLTRATADTTYYATYTAYSGSSIRSELIATRDFLLVPPDARLPELCGPQQGHGACFRGRIDGRYAMIARQDNENLFLIYSDDLHVMERRPGRS